MEAPRLPDHLLVDAVAARRVDPYGDRLLALAGHDHPLAHLALPGLGCLPGRLGRTLVGRGRPLRALLGAPAAALGALRAASLGTPGDAVVGRPRGARLTGGTGPGELATLLGPELGLIVRRRGWSRRGRRSGRRL